ncbi:MAG: hypothetical protein H7Z75_03330 [Ferruginibacter sp.]|nr:hypothetical protein [Cytophagales bacterium]
MKKTYLILLAAAVLAGSGTGCESNRIPDQQAFAAADTTTKPTTVKVSKEVLSDIIQSIPSPLEVSFLIKDMGVKYDKTSLNSLSNIANYNTNYRKALNLGIYSTDLGYANVYGQTQDALNYVGSVKEMADGLSIGQFFDFATIKRLASNSSNLDSLLLVTTTNFEKINVHLQEQDRANLSILILTGGWLEALHLTCEVVKDHPNEALRERIGDQKVILGRLLTLLKYYEADPSIRTLLADLTEMQKHYDKVQVTKEYKESTTKEVNGMLQVVDNSITKVTVTDEDLNNISASSASIRSKIIN